MLMEHNVLRSNWPTMGEHDYPAGSHPTVEQQHFPSLAPSFHSYGTYAAAPLQRFKDEASPRTFGSLYPPQQQPAHAYQHAASHSNNGSGGSNNDGHYYHSHQHHSYSSSVLGSQLPLPLPHHHALPLSLSIPRPSGIATASTTGNETLSKKASEEERKAKHREAQRRFVKRKKAEMAQLKQFAVELELQYQLCEVLNECAALERANSSLERDIEAARNQAATKQEQSESEPERPPIKLPELKFDFEW